MNNSLIERYIYAVTKRLSKEMRTDIAQELDILIEDMLRERCGELLPKEDDVHAVLKELGTPNEMYEKYNLDRKNCLIGAPYYTTYISVLKIVLVCVACGMTLSFLVIYFTTPSLIWYENLLSLLSMMYSGFTSGFAFVTIIFAIFYQMNVNITSGFNLNDLPNVPSRKKMISKKESIFSISFIVVFFVVLIVSPQIFGVVLSEPTRIIPIFNVETIRENWYVLLLFAMMGVITEIVKLVESEYNKKVMMTTIVTNCIALISTFWWLSSTNIMNPEFVSNMLSIFPNNSDFIINFFGKFNLILLGIMIVTLLIETLEAMIKSKY